jgi:hypothetical protein
LSCHSVAVVLTLIQTKQIRIDIHEQTIQKHTKYKHTNYIAFCLCIVLLKVNLGA